MSANKQLDGFSLFILSFSFTVIWQPWRVGRWTHLKKRWTETWWVHCLLWNIYLFHAGCFVNCCSFWWSFHPWAQNTTPHRDRFWSQNTQETKLTLLSRNHILCAMALAKPSAHTAGGEKSKQATKKWECKLQRNLPKSAVIDKVNARLFLLFITLVGSVDDKKLFWVTEEGKILAKFFSLVSILFSLWWTRSTIRTDWLLACDLPLSNCMLMDKPVSSKCQEDYQKKELSAVAPSLRRLPTHPNKRKR